MLLRTLPGGIPRTPQGLLRPHPQRTREYGELKECDRRGYFKLQGVNSIDKLKFQLSFQLTFQLSFASTVGHPVVLAKLNLKLN